VETETRNPDWRFRPARSRGRARDDGRPPRSRCGGELQFAPSQPDPPDIDAKIRELEARLATATANDERLRANNLEKLKLVYDALEQVVYEILPAHAGDSTLDPLAQRLALVK
jgi:hypothetical protein